MPISISKFCKELNISHKELYLRLDHFDKNHEIRRRSHEMLPDDIASSIWALYYNDLKLVKVIVQNSKSESELKTDTNIIVRGYIDLDNIDKQKTRNQTEEIKPKEFSSISTFLNESPRYNDNAPVFFIKEIFILTENSTINSINVGDFNISQQSPFFSVFIGANGVGKSSLLSEIADFFIEVHGHAINETKNVLNYKKNIVAIKYYIDGLDCLLIRYGKTCLAKVDGCVCALKYLRLPTIIACHYGAFEKFHNQSINGLGKTKYDVPYYKYVGAHINGNMISPSSIVFRLMFTISENMCEQKRKNICSILDFIQYNHTITLEYQLILKSKKSKTAEEAIEQHFNQSKEFKQLQAEEKKSKIRELYNFYKSKSSSKIAEHKLILDFSNPNLDVNNNKELQNIFELKQCNLIKNYKILFQKGDNVISSEEMSSGEFAILATIISVSSAANEPHTLILLDEPEISQHPNWQMSLIENLDKALQKQTCHMLIATHSHMIVSDLPMHRSSVIQLNKTPSGRISSTLLKSSTFGWSAEEILLKVFNTATSRNRYFAERIGKLLENMAQNTIDRDSVTRELDELQDISKHLSDVDPMKAVLNTIFKTYNR